MNPFTQRGRAPAATTHKAETFVRLKGAASKRTILGWCSTDDKIQYATRAAVKRVIAMLFDRQRKPYRCRACGYWHMSSSSK